MAYKTPRSDAMLALWSRLDFGRCHAFAMLFRFGGVSRCCRVEGRPEGFLECEGGCVAGGLAGQVDVLGH